MANVARYGVVIVPLILLFAEAQAQSGAWTRKKDMPTGRAIISAAVVNDKIYVVGGMGAPPAGAALAANEVYDPSTDTWQKLKDRPTARCFASCAAVDGILYAFGGIRFGAGGGFSGSDTTSAVDAYDPATNTWNSKANMLSPRFGASACVVDGIIYNIGGNHTQSVCEAYDPKTNVWTRKSHIPGTEGGTMATGFNGQIYAFGGGYSTSFSTVCAYDPKLDTWTRKKDMPTPRATSQVSVVGGKIYVLGGYKSIQGELVSAIEVYDPIADTWTKKPGMPFNRAFFGAAVVNGKIYVIGGTCDWTGANGGETWEYDPAFHTDIPAGYVSGRWTLSHSPYHVNGQITIPNDSTLTIDPGVEVVFMGHYKFNVQGRLLAVGTQGDSIRFTAEDTLTGWHGIRFVGTPGSNDTSKIAYCVFTYGKANTGDWGSLDRAGGAILISGFDKVVVSDCFFRSNLNEGEMYETGGAAVFIKQASPLVTKSRFQGNTGLSDFAIKCVYASKAIISNNVISHSTGEWDAIVCEHTAENRPLITGNIISHNVSRQGGGGIGFYRTSNARIENNIIVHNSGVGGGIVCSVAGSPVIVNNTIAYNSATYGGGGIACRRGSNPILINNILYGNSAPLGRGPQVGLDDDAADPVILYCNIQGGKEGFGGNGIGSYYTGLYVNNIDADPGFVNAAAGDYRLSDSSPCLGAGVDSIGLQGVWYHAPRACFGANPRPSPAGSSPDIGACENLLGEPVTGVDEAFDALPTWFALEQNYPNPFNPTTVIRYGVPGTRGPGLGTSNVRLVVYDLLGREVATLVDGNKPAGVHEVKCDAAGLASGVYLYRLMAGDFVETKKLTVLK
jgi:N-acetylneuraminic acid mutarotase